MKYNAALQTHSNVDAIPAQAGLLMLNGQALTW
jgi:hypothetical protein